MRCLDMIWLCRGAILVRSLCIPLEGFQALHLHSWGLACAVGS